MSAIATVLTYLVLGSSDAISPRNRNCSCGHSYSLLQLNFKNPEPSHCTNKASYILLISYFKSHLVTGSKGVCTQNERINYHYELRSCLIVRHRDCKHNDVTKCQQIVLQFLGQVIALKLARPLGRYSRWSSLILNHHSIICQMRFIINNAHQQTCFNCVSSVTKKWFCILRTYTSSSKSITMQASA